jgi:hypothetical protein
LRDAGARLPFRVFGFAARFTVVTAADRPLVDLAARSEPQTRDGIADIGLAIPLCRWHLPRLCGFPVADRADYS